MPEARLSIDLNPRGGGFALFALGFRPFFLGAAVAALALMGLWLGVLGGHLAAPGYYPGTGWHAHEMLLGYLGTVIAGFLLIAVRNWTGVPTPTGVRLAGLAGVWLAAGLAPLLSVPGPLIAALDLAFFPLLALSPAPAVTCWPMNWPTPSSSPRPIPGPEAGPDRWRPWSSAKGLGWRRTGSPNVRSMPPWARRPSIAARRSWCLRHLNLHKRPDIVDFDLLRGEIAAWDLTFEPNNPYHRFKTAFYAHVLVRMTGLRVSAADVTARRGGPPLVSVPVRP